MSYCVRQPRRHALLGLRAASSPPWRRPLSPWLPCCLRLLCLFVSGLPPWATCRPWAVCRACCSFLSAIDLNSRALGDAHLAARSPSPTNSKPTRVGLPSLGSASARLDRWIGRLLGDDAAFLLRGLPLVALDHVDAAHERAALRPGAPRSPRRTALVAAGDHDDLVALPDFRRHHSTSGASEMIFMWFLARSSRGTGPKMRVPTGSICG